MFHILSPMYFSGYRIREYEAHQVSKRFSKYWQLKISCTADTNWALLGKLFCFGYAFEINNSAYNSKNKYIICSKFKTDTVIECAYYTMPHLDILWSQRTCMWY